MLLSNLDQRFDVEPAPTYLNLVPIAPVAISSVGSQSSLTSLSGAMGAV
jgi:hypothetical protein